MPNEPISVPIQGDYIELNKFLKLEGLVESGAVAKIIIKEGLVKVDGEPELRVRRKLYLGSEVEFENSRYKVSSR